MMSGEDCYCGSPHSCEVCGGLAKGASYDRQWNALHWYCRAHHPMMPGGVAAITGPPHGVVVVHSDH